MGGSSNKRAAIERAIYPTKNAPGVPGAFRVDTLERFRAYLRRKRRAAKPIAPRPKIAIEAGSGTASVPKAVMVIPERKNLLGFVNDCCKVYVKFAVVGSCLPEPSNSVPP